MSKIKSLEELFLEELKDLYNAENQLVAALPRIAEATESMELKFAINEHWEQTKIHVHRLEEAFATLGEKPAQVTCKAMRGLIDESRDVLHKSDRCAARDAGIIGAAQRVEHYEIAAYGTAQSHAAMLGHNRIEALLNETLVEEKEANAKLTDIAEGSVNLQAR